MKADSERVLRELYELRQIGTYKSGVHRPTFSPEDMQARHWLADRLREIGHEATIDAVGNVFGRAKGDGPHLLAGSHIETQNHSGWLDGALGVVYALEAARAAVEAGTPGGIDVIAFADEEGHFSGGFVGSQSFTGDLDPGFLDVAEDRSGRGTFRALQAQAGLDDAPTLRMEKGRYKAFLEAHIEQGDSLEADGLTIGVVTSIVGIWGYRLTFEGVQNHAGTTRMAIRRDAGRAAMRLWSRIEETFPDVAAERSVWTIGRVTLAPGDPSIIPGGAEMLVQMRDADPLVLAGMRGQLQALVAEANAEGFCKVTLETLVESKPAIMDPTVQSAFDAAADAIVPGKHHRMPSGAGHDAQQIAKYLPCGMLFIPSIGGISHHWSEDSHDDDIKRGSEVYVDAARRLLEN